MVKRKFNCFLSLIIVFSFFTDTKGQHSIAQNKIFSQNDDYFTPVGNTLSAEDKSMSPEKVDINQIPFFGRVNKTHSQIEEDQKFLSDCKLTFKNDEEASLFFSNMAWQYLSEGNKEMAIHRFNLAWLLKKDNSDVYWGIGVIDYQNKQIEEAIETMEKGIMVAPKKDLNLMLDLATIYLKENKADNDYLKKSEILLNQIIASNPKYISAYQQLCVNYLIQNLPNLAWDAFHKAFEIDPSNVNVEILSELKSQLPDPKGIF